MRHRNGLATGAVLACLTIFYLAVRGKPRTTKSSSAVTVFEKVHIVAAIKAKDHDWAYSEVRDWTTAVYIVDDPDAPLHTQRNKGREANVYLTYILENYERLPEIMVFTHQHDWSNHVDKAFANNADSINLLSLDNVLRNGYQSLSCDVPSNCDMSIDSFNNFAHDSGGTSFEEGWRAIFRTPIPDIVTGPPFAQFAVSRAAVLGRPKSDYQRMHDWLMATIQSDQRSGRVFEHTWHHIFGKPAFYCPRRQDCLCDGFGFCDPQDVETQKAVDMTRWMDATQKSKEYLEWKEKHERQGLDADLTSYWNERMLQDLLGHVR